VAPGPVYVWQPIEILLFAQLT